MTSSHDTAQILQQHVALYLRISWSTRGYLPDDTVSHPVHVTFSLSSYSLSFGVNSLLQRHDSTKRTPASLQNTKLNKLYFFLLAVTCLLVTTSNFSVRCSTQPNHQPLTHTAAKCRLSQYTTLRANTGTHATAPFDKRFFDIT